MSKYVIDQEEWNKLQQEYINKVNNNLQTYLKYRPNFWITITKEKCFENVFVNFKAAKEHAIKNDYLLYGIAIRFNKNNRLETIILSKLKNENELEIVYDYDPILDNLEELREAFKNE